MNDQQIETEIQAKGLTAPRVRLADIEDAIERIDIVKHVSTSGQVLRWAVLNMRNGFAITGRPSCSVSPENDNDELGKKIATDNAISEAWPLLGYALKERLAAVPADFRDRVRLELRELDAKIDALAKFMPTETFGKLTTEEQDRMTAQLAAMQDYSGCLTERVAAFTA